MKYVLIIVSVLFLLIVAGWAGFQITPKGFEPERHTVSGSSIARKATSDVQSVSAYYDRVFDGDAIETNTSVVSGRARFNIKGIPMKGRFITFYKAGEGFYRYIEVTWFGIPVISGYDLYTKDRAEFCMAGKVETGERIEQGQNLALWAESVWSPAMLSFSDELEWREVDDRTAVMQIPYLDGHDTLTVFFGKDGLIEKMEAMRFKGNQPEKSLWEIACIDWMEFSGMTIPVSSSVKWGDETKPWAYWTVERVGYNIPVSDGFIGEMETYGQVRGK